MEGDGKLVDKERKIENEGEGNLKLTEGNRSMGNLK